MNLMPLTRLSIFLWQIETDRWKWILNQVPKINDEYTSSDIKWLERQKQMANRENRRGEILRKEI